MFAYGKRIHDSCERRAHFDGGQFVEAWGDEGHRSGYCLFKLGCKGPATFHNCPQIGWNGNTSWPIGCGHPCIGCSEPRFWDTMTPFYTHLTGFGGGVNVDRIGLIAAGVVGAGLAGHGLVRLGARLARRHDEKQAAAGESAPPPPAAPSGAAPAKGGAR
jgi:hydrogenase small subunit